MLQNLHVKNLALIDEAEVEFESGLNILTGETGAGKSLLLGSINLALGGKVSKDLIREDQEYALVELLFTVEEEWKLQELKSMELPFDIEGQVIISRKIMNGRSISKVNGETVSAAELKRITGLLIDIHGQHEHQSLLYKAKHLEILDEFAGKKVEELKQELGKTYEEYISSQKITAQFQMNEEQRLREISFLKFEIEEIENAQLQPGEEEELTNWYKKAKNAKKIAETLSLIYEELNSDVSGGASEVIGRAVRECSQIIEYDELLQPIQEQLENIDTLLSDVCRETAQYMASLDFDENQFIETEKRLDFIHNLELKYGKDIEEIYAYQKQKQERLEILENYQLNKEKAQKEEEEIRRKLEKLCEKISQIRKEVSAELIKKVTEALKDLNFLETDFDILFEQTKGYTKNGFDQVEFLISTNPGEPLKSLGKIASGGELSRIMLAIKTILSDKDGVNTLIFDEIDTGISGRTAQMVSEKLRQISRRRQVICITHLAQIAAMADSHYVIEKFVVNQRTVTNIRWLTQEESIKELARILGGAIITDTILESAREMKELVKRTK